ncbi:MAG: hypothetical protein H0X44_08345 [Acidobacteria bacterium]|nr:hypothetical protein [Acidobacteriota bacterium]
MTEMAANSFFLSSLGVLAAGIFLLSLGLSSLIRPADTQRFLASIASSARAHFVEMFARLALGAAFISAAPRLKFAALFVVFGWVLVATTLVLLAVPWKWHRRFASWSVPIATRNMALFAIGPVAGGIVVLYALL